MYAVADGAVFGGLVAAGAVDGPVPGGVPFDVVPVDNHVFGTEVHEDGSRSGAIVCRVADVVETGYGRTTEGTDREPVVLVALRGLVIRDVSSVSPSTSGPKNAHRGVMDLHPMSWAFLTVSDSAGDSAEWCPMWRSEKLTSLCSAMGSAERPLARLRNDLELLGPAPPQPGNSSYCVLRPDQGTAFRPELPRRRLRPRSDHQRCAAEP